MARMTKAQCYEAATAPVSDLETVIEELDQLQTDAPKSQQERLESAKNYLQHAVDTLMDLEN